MSKALKIGIIFVISTFLVSITFFIDGKSTFLTDKFPMVEELGFQTSSVMCVDTENYGQGANRARICAHGTTPYCDWQNYEPPATYGNTCTLEDEDDDGPEEPVENP